MISIQHWFRLWLDAVKQQAITWANVDQDVCHHVASLEGNELTYVVSPVWHQAIAWTLCVHLSINPFNFWFSAFL